MKIAYLLATFDKVLDAKIQMEIIKNHLELISPEVSFDIFHIYDGADSNYEKYLEYRLIRTDNKGYYLGALNVINMGIEVIVNENAIYDAIIVSSGDVWILNVHKLYEIIKEFTDSPIQLCVTLWPSLLEARMGFGTEFFMIKPKLAYQVFPLDKPILDNKLIKICEFFGIPLIEELFYTKIMKELKLKNILQSQKDIMFLNGRKVHYILNRHVSNNLGYCSSHDLTLKRNFIRKTLKPKPKDIFLKRLLSSKTKNRGKIIQ